MALDSLRCSQRLAFLEAIRIIVSLSEWVGLAGVEGGAFSEPQIRKSPGDGRRQSGRRRTAGGAELTRSDMPLVRDMVRQEEGVVVYSHDVTSASLVAFGQSGKWGSSPRCPLFDMLSGWNERCRSFRDVSRPTQILF